MSNSAEEFLASHGDPRPKPLLEDGATVDGWRVTALLGRGGSGEVYRVVGRRVPTPPQSRIDAQAEDAARLREKRYFERLANEERKARGLRRQKSGQASPQPKASFDPAAPSSYDMFMKTPAARTLLQEQKRISDATKRISDMMGRQKSITNMHEWTEYSKMILQEMTNFHTHIEKTATNHIAR